MDEQIRLIDIPKFTLFAAGEIDNGYPAGSFADQFKYVAEKSSYVLPQSTATLLGGIKLGSKLLYNSTTSQVDVDLSTVVKSVNGNTPGPDGNVTINSSGGGMIDETNIVHKNGDETIGTGVKTFTNSPIVPTPTTANQAANKDYIDKGLAIKQPAIVGNTSFGLITTNDQLPSNILDTEVLIQSYLDGGRVALPSLQVSDGTHLVGVNLITVNKSNAVDNTIYILSAPDVSTSSSAPQVVLARIQVAESAFFYGKASSVTNPAVNNGNPYIQTTWVLLSLNGEFFQTLTPASTKTFLSGTSSTWSASNELTNQSPAFSKFGMSYTDANYHYKYTYSISDIDGSKLNWIRIPVISTLQLTQDQVNSIPNGVSATNKLALASQIASTFPYIVVTPNGQKGYTKLEDTPTGGGNTIFINTTTGTLLTTLNLGGGLSIDGRASTLTINNSGVLTIPTSTPNNIGYRTTISDLTIIPQSSGAKDGSIIITKGSTANPSVFEYPRFVNCDVYTTLKFTGTSIGLILEDTRVSTLTNNSTNPSNIATVYLIGNSSIGTVGANINVVNLNSNAYTLPQATSTVLGGIQLGAKLIYNSTTNQVDVDSSTFVKSVNGNTPNANGDVTINSSGGGSIDETNIIHKSGDETFTSGIKTFTNSPLVPTPTTDNQASNKKYIDDRVSAISSGVSIFPEYTATSDGAQSISLPSDAKQIDSVYVLEASGYSRIVYPTHYSLSGTTLTITVDAAIKSGSKITGYYVNNITAGSGGFQPITTGDGTKFLNNKGNYSKIPSNLLAVVTFGDQTLSANDFRMFANSSASYNPVNAWNNTNNRFTAPSDGAYRFDVIARLADNTPAGKQYGLGINPTASDDTSFAWKATSAALRQGANHSRVMFLNAGDTIIIYSWSEIDAHYYNLQLTIAII